MLMILLKSFAEFIFSMNSYSRFLMKMTYILFVLLIFSSLMCISVAADIFSDTDTMMYWFEEIGNTAIKILFLGIPSSVLLGLIYNEE